LAHLGNFVNKKTEENNSAHLGNFVNKRTEENNSAHIQIYNTSIKYIINESREAFGSGRGLLKHAIPNVM